MRGEGNVGSIGECFRYSINVYWFTRVIIFVFDKEYIRLADDSVFFSVVRGVGNVNISDIVYCFIINWIFYFVNK